MMKGGVYFGYDRCNGQFAPNGMLPQLQYSTIGSQSGPICIGFVGKDSVVIGIENFNYCPLYEKDSAKRIFVIDDNIAVVVVGFISDGYAVADVGRQEASNFKRQFNFIIPANQIVKRIGYYMHAYTVFSTTRPFGCSLNVVQYTPENGGQMFKINPDGSYLNYFALGSGKAKDVVENLSSKYNVCSIDCTTLVKEVGRIIYKLHNFRKFPSVKLDLVVIGAETNGKVEYNEDYWMTKALSAGQTYKNTHR